MFDSPRVTSQGITTSPVQLITGGSETGLVRNLGPSNAYIGEGDTTNGATITEANSWLLAVGEEFELPDYGGSSDGKRFFVSTLSGTANLMFIGTKKVSS